MKWEVVIGLEVHTQLSTQSKIFSGSSTAFGAAPNTQASAVDIALPGVLPVMNRAAVDKAIDATQAVIEQTARLKTALLHHVRAHGVPWDSLSVSVALALDSARPGASRRCSRAGPRSERVACFGAVPRRAARSC